MRKIFGLGFLLFALPLQAQHISGEVYGGGHNGKVSGSTSVAATSGEVGQDRWVGTPSGGVFGAGEGDSATVSGSTAVNISGGIIRNSIYGGGKRGNLLGNSNVEITGGIIHTNVYGGARMADIKGYTYVYVHDDAKTTSSPVLGAVYGGNDIAGDVKNDLGGTGRTAPDFYASLPDSVKPSVIPTTFVRVGMTNVAHQPYIGSLYGGSDGGYDYTPNGTRYDVTLPNDNTDPHAGSTVLNVSTPPVLDRTYLEFGGGTVGNMFAGGDNVTVTDAADIHLAADQTLAAATIDTTCFRGDDAFLKSFDAENYTVTGSKATFDYQINRCFGGNNMTEMKIRPNWHLVSAHVNNLYSGGNNGDMTYPNGILICVEGKDMIAHNVFGGCRLSDVHPSKGTIDAETLEGFDFPAGYAARVLIKGGKVYNVYGGNDVSGQVYNGANVVVRSSIIENVYGSGNGSYAYYSNKKYEGTDFYFQANGLSGVDAIDALNTHRPNTENVLIDIAGTKSKTTFIAGNVFCGGNSATLRDLTGNLELARATVKVGSYVTANGVFLGSNGDQMLNEDIIIQMNSDEYNPDIDLTVHEQMAEYMRGVEVAVKPKVEFAADYVPYSTYIGSFFCGGNKGSMTAAGTFTIDFLKSVRIFDKLVAGSNDANVLYKGDSKKQDGTENPLVNHSYVLGGLTSEAHPKVLLNVTGLQTEPKKITYDAVAGTYSFDWNRYTGDASEGDMAAYKGFLHGGNIYGGCYSSGYVNGDVQINISQSILTDDTYIEMQTIRDKDGKPTGKYGINDYDWDHHVFEPFISTITCYGGGYGEETEIWGNTTINLTNTGHLMKIRGGGEMGWVGKMKRDSTTGAMLDDPNVFKAYYYNDSTKFAKITKKQVEQAYDATVHVNADLLGDPNDKSSVFNNVAEMCGGGFAGVVTGNTHALVDNGCVYTVFGGASNAHIYGSAETIIGKNGFPYITQTVYGGNDFGGQIMGSKVYETKNQADGSIQKVKCNTYVEYFSGEIGYGTGEASKPDTVSADFGIFGGGYGFYDYRTKTGNKYYGKCKSQPNLLDSIVINMVEGVPEADFSANTFVNISSKTTDDKDKIMRIYGGGQGYPGQMGVANTRQTYVLFNAANANARPNYLAQYVFGAGDCAATWYSRLDAYSGNARHIFGANRGASYVQNVDVLAKSNSVKSRAGAESSNVAGMIKDLTYMGEYSVMNIYPTMVAPQMEVFASGAFSGTKQTYLNLYGGHVAEVYGASYEEGITYLTEVNVPEGSTIKCKAIYGGGKGMFENLPCDTYLSTIHYHSADATVEEGIFGGNCDFRFTRRSMIDIDVPVKNSLGELVNVYGAGKGANTISEIAFVNLRDGAKVRNVYGGSCDGLVYNKPSVIQYMLTKDYYKDQYTTGTDTTSYYLGDCETSGFNIWKNQKGVADRVLFPGSGYDLTIGTLAPLSMGWTKEQYEFNTDVHIHNGAIVTENAYGGGYGANAATAGTAGVHLLGGTVTGNIYGGGYGGTVIDTLHIAGTTLKNNVGPIEMNVRTKVYLQGGTCTNSFGSGLNGNVIGNTYTYVGLDVCGTDSTVSYLNGDPTVARSLYGGGEQGAVQDTAFVYLYNGHIGYVYDAAASEDSLRYVANIDYKAAADSILYNNGNVFGGGYGEGAYTVNTNIVMDGGVIRNSLYGGGEIAAVGVGAVTKDNASGMPELKSITTPGQTHIYMYGGHVLRDVFGGGRGYSYNLEGDEVVGTKYYTDGYVFGKTDVNIYRGEVGTGDQRSIDLGYGNVFGGGNVGFVYSAEGTKATETSGNRTKGYYYKGSSDVLSEDCRVVISPYTKVIDKKGVTVNGKKYSECSYVPTEDLNYLYAGLNKSDSATWAKMDYLTGVVVHNAIFAGGNVTRGDSKLYADTRTVYGNATASLNDIYYRDLITVGTEHTGGIYGDGNLTKVDGFREICVANYGTDYYGLQDEIDTTTYYKLNDREKAYFQLMYKCITPYDKYIENQTISIDVYKLMTESEKKNWIMAGFCSVYAGRLLNTIQRADFVGIHGSRVVLQGAQDRTVSVVDYMEYAINRVGELSLNQRKSSITGDTSTQNNHGNYFGFYNTVNYLEALTSDVDFESVRETTNEQHPADGKTYKEYKIANQEETWVNNGTSMNSIALLSGVYLEITTQESTDSLKVYGPITGVVELDLIDMGKNMGGAFVYAKNIHGARSGSMNTHAYISSYNQGAKTHQGYSYGSTDTGLETSGNFVHPSKAIVDECYPGASDITSPGHYWYLRGSIYVYDQYISAYTGASTAYKADVQIPLTITAGTHGRLKVLAIQPNLYAYYEKGGKKKLANDGKVVIDATTYKLNDVITYWDWSQLATQEEKDVFVHDTYIATKEFKYLPSSGDSVTVSKGDVMLTSDYEALPDNVTVSGVSVAKDEVVHISNGTSHTNGYALTADISNPKDWDDRYIHITDASKVITKEEYEKLTASEKSNYFVGPSYRAKAGVYGQTDYNVGDIINDEIHGAYTKIPQSQIPANQATVKAAYLTTGEISYTYNGVKKTLQAGVGISEDEYKEAIKVTGNKARLSEAYVCNSTLQTGENYIITGELISSVKYESLSKSEKTQFSKAWICTAAGRYGGTIYDGTQNYDALKGWCDLTATDRESFTFNYDAFDLFLKDLDPDATIEDYDKPGTNYYSREIELDYKARCRTTFTYTDKSGDSHTYTAQVDTLSRQEYESVPNERIHYAYLKVSKDIPVYVANQDFTLGDWPYTTGDTISALTYNRMPDSSKPYVTKLTFSEGGEYYYCKQTYQVNEYGEGADVTNIYGTSTTYTKDQTVPVGAIISAANYMLLPNLQKNFSVVGVAPTETSTLYVARDANMEDVMKDRVITLIYQYQFDESTSDHQMSTITERHVVNIHLLFRSGAPSVGRLKVPGAVLPGSTVGLKQPSVTKGAYEILGGGWEIYNSQADADNHINGTPYTNNSTVLYFYQTGQYVTYYAKTYMGKTYSNAVQLSVANYHSINDVMADTEHYMYIDNPDVPRNCKIYIDNDAFKADTTKSELDLLKDLYDLSVKDNSPLSTHVKGCKNLDFVLQQDVSPKYYKTWTPLGTADNCFGNNGFFHGDGHSVIGIDNSLFGNYCGNVFNLGVRGSFAGAGIAQQGQYAANCWVWNENEAGHADRPIFADANPNIDNCYYYEDADATQKYTPVKAIRKDETAFNNGEVAYDLNKYYLNKRYTDNLTTPLGTNPYSYWTIKSDNSLELHDNTGYNTDDDAFITIEYLDDNKISQTKKLSYVEYRYWDGDFVNADAELHTTADERYYNGYYYPIYPDDYIFFGQGLNYGYVGEQTHDRYPVSIVRSDDNRILLANNSSNRVFRAPAYFGTMDKCATHFNVDCVVPYQYNKELSKTTDVVVKRPTDPGESFTILTSGSQIDVKRETLADGSVKTTRTTTADDLDKQTRTITTEVSIGKMIDVYPNMTAIDFTGSGDYDYYKGVSNGVFYTPILDYKTLIGFTNPDESRNMLVYANSTSDAQGYDVLSSFLQEPKLEFTDATYKNIPKITETASNSVQGHLVDKVGTAYVTDRNHFLVDENNFHCPIAFNMGDKYRMWYQRTPCTFSNGSNGYESIVLPFTAKLVSAHSKGEITHFYDNDKNNHEYWLRGFKGATTTGSGTAADPYVTTLKFIRPMNAGDGADIRYESAGTGTDAYKVKNDFLYDYYYSNSKGQDDNKDGYQQSYYQDERSYDNYVYLTANVPYLMAFPGQRYYEFDMSGEFIPSNTFASIDQLEKQNVSFCSEQGAAINTLAAGDLISSYDGYTYEGIFQKRDMTASAEDNARIITTVGDKFAKRDKIYLDQPEGEQELTVMQPFHAYLRIPSGSEVKEFFIGEDASYIVSANENDGNIVITSRDRAIFIANHTGDTVYMQIVNAAGQLVATLSVASGKTESHEAPSAGVYMVNNQKVLVK